MEISRENPFGNGYFYSYLELPAEDYEIRDALHKVRINEGDALPHAVRITNSYYLYALTDLRLDSPAIEELNFLSKRLREMDGVTHLVYESIVGKVLKADRFVSVKDLINCTYNLDDVPVACNVANDAQLGAFIIENEMYEDVNAVLESSLYLLDHSKIGELYRKKFGTVYNTGLCVFAGDYEMPEIYDGKTLPEESHSAGFAFRLRIDKTPTENEELPGKNAEWINLPIARDEADRIAVKHGESCIENCVYYDFESSLPQIHSEQFNSMQDFDKLNCLAVQMLDMSPIEQLKFKAALCAERPLDISSALGIAENLHSYEFDARIANDTDFFRKYLAHHLDSSFDTQWLDSLPVNADAGRLLYRLGASVTDYGAISARGHSLYELVSYNAPTPQAVAEDIDDSCITEDEDMTMGGMQM